MELGINPGVNQQAATGRPQGKNDPKNPTEEVSALPIDPENGQATTCDTIELDGVPVEVCRESNASLEEPGVIVLDGVEVPVVRSSSSRIINVNQ